MQSNYLDKKIDISVVIPVYNDEEVLSELYKRLIPVLSSLANKFEVLLIDDGSMDNSWLEIMRLHELDNRIIGVKLARNFGQQNSIAAGLSFATMEYVAIMDSDLQDRPEDIPLLLKAMFEQNAVMAIAQWESREDSFFKLFVSSLFYKVSNKITSIHTQPRLGVFRVMQRNVIEELKKFQETTSTTISLLYYIGSNYVAVPLKRDARFAGKSGYNLRKMLTLTSARIFSFSLFPIRLATYIGITITILSFLIAIVLVIRRCLDLVAPGWTSIVVLILFLFGLNFAFLGIIGEYLGKIFLETKHRPKFIVESIVK